MMINYCIAMVLFTSPLTATASSPRKLAHRPLEEASARKEEDSSSLRNRFLGITESLPCPNSNPGHNDNFLLDIELVPQSGHDLGECNLQRELELGHAINDFLFDLGIGQHGVGDGTAFLAEVCDLPTEGRRKLAASVFRYYGGGVCRFCLWDNLDGRRLLEDEEWFNTVFKPEVQDRLSTSFVQSVGSNHWSCLGDEPQVLVNIAQVDETPSPGCWS